MKSRYAVAKEVFIDSVDTVDYIELDNSYKAFKKLEQSINKPLKMILLFGSPGTGKSMLLSHLYEKLKDKKEIHFFDTPAINQKEFYYKIFQVLTGKDLPPNTEVNFSALVNYCKKLRGKREIVILLDEAQMYGPDLMEKIRLLSDSRTVKFIVSLHKTEDEDLIAKAHFQSRIWEVIELKNASVEDLATYIQKKLLKRNLFEIANSFKSKQVQMIHRFTKGNFRECNKMMYAIFDICEYYDTHEPNKIDYTNMSRRIIEMAAIKLGYIHV